MTEIITSDRRMLDIIQLAKTVAPSKATIMIQGESGTGKELMARLLHENSSRVLKPFVAINCAAIPENLLESELFGYERGSFTGANMSKPGKFENANGGTLFLDEISEMEIHLQAKLLRAIQQGEVDRIGGRKPIPVDVRIIATTNRDLSDCVRKGSFREDLFYRLNVVNLTLPPLRERMGDIRILANRFLEMNNRTNHKSIQGFSADGLAVLEAHQWPGNIRELENVVERAVITTQSDWITGRDITIERREGRMDLASRWAVGQSQDATQGQGGLDIAAQGSSQSSSWLPGSTLDDIERSVIIAALAYHQGNRTHTAKSLGISIRTLRNKIADYKKIGIYV
ncbi:MAG: sigma-54 interaction domain-containing protein [Bdellovibrionia bacterium]